MGEHRQDWQDPTWADDPDVCPACGLTKRECHRMAVGAIVVALLVLACLVALAVFVGS